MDGNENPPPPPPSPPRAVTSLPIAALAARLSSLSAHPLFSAALAFYALVLLYFPRIFLRVLLSPVLALTALSLLALLRLGAAQRAREPEGSAAAEECGVRAEEKSGELRRDSCRADGPRSEVGFAPSARYECSFAVWDVKAPLDVIYEEYEGEGDEEEDDCDCDGGGGGGFGFGGLERYPSLSMCYPESDSDSESLSPGGDFGFGFESPENGVFRWDSEDGGGEGMIEISLDLPPGDGGGGGGGGGEEENLIEIDISSGEKVSRRRRLD
ncbi:uncharacterized protein LOC104445523 [Eucalyptus grandis]|uniref:uncharacterized protein LOC104445523 n=1 Tax=Eucalyptus grandis TaxID=71139 RepID=UPI00192F06C5|nr:uncharacterized protein LOC104445523 [Eucalyptus grandis]